MPRPRNGFAGVWADSLARQRLALPLCLGGLSALGIALLPVQWAAAAVLGGMALLAIVIWPQLGVLLIIPAVPFGSALSVRLGGGNLGVTEVLLGWTFAAWLAGRVAGREPIPHPGRLAWAMLLFIATLLVSLPGSGSLEQSLIELAKWIEVLALYILVSDKLNGRWTKALVAVALATGALAALQGIYQFLFRIGPEGFTLFGRFMRAYGTFDQPNPYGGYLGLLLPFAVGLIAISLRRRGNGPSWPWLAAASAAGALMIVALAMSWSRGAWLGFGAAMAAMAAGLVVRSGRAVVLALVLLVVLAYLAFAAGLLRVPVSVVERVGEYSWVGLDQVRGAEITDENYAVLERLAHWQAAIDMWTDRPWTGVGIGNYEVAYPQYALPFWPLALGHAHNYYLNIAAEAGTVGLLAYLALWGTALVGVWREVRYSSGWHLALALGVLGVVVHLGVHNLVDNLYVHGMYLHVAVLLGVAIPSARKQQAAR